MALPREHGAALVEVTELLLKRLLWPAGRRAFKSYRKKLTRASHARDTLPPSIAGTCGYG
jgi:hypothetical protein